MVWITGFLSIDPVRNFRIRNKRFGTRESYETGISMSIRISDNKRFFRGNVESVKIRDKPVKIDALGRSIEIAVCRRRGAAFLVGGCLQQDSEYKEAAKEKRDE